jgi:predicted Na+-dependent transporter
MMTLIILNLLAGLVLGQRFKVLVLVPAIVLALLVAIGAGIARGDGVWSTALMAGAVGMALQIGYLAGLFIGHIPALGRARRTASSLPGSAPPRGAH